MECVGGDMVTDQDGYDIYEITHRDEYGFGGYTQIKIFLERETKDRLYGWMDQPNGENEIVVMKDNVASYQKWGTTDA